MKKCKNCGSLIHRGMYVICENCGEELKNKNDALDDFITEIKKEKIEVVWESKEQRKWVISQCRKFSFDPNHPDILRKLISDYNHLFGKKLKSKINH